MNGLKFPFLFFFILLFMFMAACIEYPNTNKAPAGPRKTPSLSLTETALPDEVTWRAVSDQNNGGVLVDEVSFGSLTVRLWKPEGNGPFPAVLLLPSIWGDRTLEGFAQELVKKGFVCLQMSSQRYFMKLRSLSSMTLDSIAASIQLQVLESAKLVDWLAQQPAVDPERIGVLGISLGAIVASLLTESKERIEAAAYLLGGGNLPEIMISPQGYVKSRIRRRIMQEEGLTEAQFKEEAITALKPVDPLTYAGRLASKRILMVNGRFDRVIPYPNARELWEALGEPDWIVLPAGHYTASLFNGYLRYRVAQHFLAQLASK